jgi:surfactin synthase thioesterase subunit
MTVGKTKTAIAVICLPFAGAGASMFNEWCRYCGGRVEIVAPQLPGREKRFEDPPYGAVEDAVSDLFLATRKHLNGRTQVAFFGHSMGAILAYELAQKCSSTAGMTVLHLFVSGSPAPWIQRAGRASGLSDQQFIERVVEFAGYRHWALDDPEMRELLLPTLRADVEMHEGYQPSSAEKITFPVTAIRGSEDQLVSCADIAEWGKATSGSFRLVELPGGHMYLVENPGGLVRLIEETAAESLLDCASA